MRPEPARPAAKAKSLTAWTWKPGTVPAVMLAVLRALESLVQHAAGERDDPPGE
jgi:hypothetical protein